MKRFILTSLAIIFSLASFAQIVPASGTLCAGSTLYLMDSTMLSGTWSSSSTGIATVDSSGMMTGVSGGIVTISYSVGGSVATGTYTVVPAPTAIGASSTSFCVGSGETLTDATPGGTWSSGATWIATVNAATGAVTGISGGNVTIYYTVASGCSASIDLTVTAATTGYIYGLNHVCVGSSIALVDSGSVGGTWSSSTLSVATVGSSTGVVTGVSDGTTTITYTTSGACGTSYATYVVTVGPISVGSVTGPTSITAGSTGSYGTTGGVTGGTWSINPTTVATVNPATGVVTALTAGSAIITYSATSCGVAVTATANITITSLDGISGNVIFTSPFYGSVKVWLITYNTGTSILAAVDSTTLYCSGTSVYYQFTGLATDSFRVKAAVPDSAGILITGPIPTYHDSSFYWYNARAIAHTSGTSDINENINMLYGSTVSGPGFIGGNVYTGANRGTSGSIPVVGLNIVAMNTTTSTIAGMVSTDASGNYSFSALPYGTYTIFPDSLNYATTPYTNITISASAPNYSGAGFIQHTISNTITPIAEGVNNVTASSSTVAAFPNPTSGRLNVQWNEKAAEKSTIIISDITGREVYHTTVNMTQGAGVTAIDLSALTNGMYMISIKSASLNYISKIEVAH